MQTIQKLLPDIDKIEQMAFQIYNTLEQGGKMIICGNGGSNADAQHFAAELVGRFLKERQPFAAIALGSDSSITTAVGNDYGFEQLFSRQIQAIGNSGDLLFAISTSGNSPNILAAANEANRKNITTIGLLGNSGGQLKPLCKNHLIISSTETPRIQEAHILVIHILCEIIEQLHS